MKKYFLILFFASTHIITCAQNPNLVSNPNFEEFTCAPWYTSSIENCNHWSNPTMNSPDYFNNDCKENKTVAIPDLHWWGYQLPKKGNSYVGFFAYRPTNKNQEESIAEYIQAELTAPLIANEKYRIKLHISLAECSTLALKKLGIYFSENKIKEKTVLLLKHNPQVTTHTNINDTTEWIAVEETFIAKGTEKFMIIGCFNTGEKIAFNKVNHANAIKDPRGEAYYYVDDISLVQESISLAENKVSDLSKKKATITSVTLPIVESKTSTSKTIVYFDFNKSDLKPAAIKTLDSLAIFLKDKNCWMVDATGYCDNTGNRDFNQILSEKRADAVYNYIKANYKNSIRALSSKGNSTYTPIGDNVTEEGKAKNRRVEIVYTLAEPTKTIVEQKVEPILEKAESSIVMEKPKILDKKSKIEDLDIGKILILENLNFVGGTSTLLKESEPSLKLLLKLLKENPTMEIEIEGHVCCANDMALSVDRALTVMEYLVNNGIKEKRLKYAGHSWNNPIASDATEEGRKTNRRVEIMILKK